MNINSSDIIYDIIKATVNLKGIILDKPTILIILVMAWKRRSNLDSITRILMKLTENGPTSKLKITANLLPVFIIKPILSINLIFTSVNFKPHCHNGYFLKIYVIKCNKATDIRDTWLSIPKTNLYGSSNISFHM